MLRDLRIQNFAIIDHLEVQFQSSLNVLTGETGSGKSIVVDAVALLLGGRASADQIRDGCEEAVLEASFDLPADSSVAEALRLLDLSPAPDEDLIVRRVLNRSGKTRAYLNGRQATLSQLQEVGNLLVDLHGQHDHQTLLRADHQIYFLDAFGDLLALKKEYGAVYREMKGIETEIGGLEGEERERFQRVDLLSFQRDEIQSAGLSPGEDARLEGERSLLANSHRLSILSEEAYQALYGSDGAILGLLAGVEKGVRELSALDPRMNEASETASAATAQLQDLAGRLRDYQSGLEHNPLRLEEVEERIYRLNTLKKKYAPTVEGILSRLEEIRNELDGLSNREERLSRLRENLDRIRIQCLDLAGRISDGRRRAGKRLARRVQEELAPLGMEKTRVEIRIDTRPGPENLGPEGSDRVEFLVSPNPGEEPKALSKIASGGELSRIMLSLKSILSAADQVPTLIFDEVDAGIGGAVAEAVGRRLKSLARHRQVLCITHLPQIASQGARHYIVEKNLHKGRTVTKVKPVDREERIGEIARMLGGRQTTEAAIRHAREMLDLGAG